MGFTLQSYQLLALFSQCVQPLSLSYILDSACQTLKESWPDLCTQGHQNRRKFTTQPGYGTWSSRVALTGWKISVKCHQGSAVLDNDLRCNFHRVESPSEAWPTRGPSAGRISVVEGEELLPLSLYNSCNRTTIGGMSLCRGFKHNQPCITRNFCFAWRHCSAFRSHLHRRGPS